MSPNVTHNEALAKKLNSGINKLTKLDLTQSKIKFVPSQESYQGYQRSGALLFNNINSHDTNASNNN